MIIRLAVVPWVGETEELFVYLVFSIKHFSEKTSNKTMNYYEHLY